MPEKSVASATWSTTWRPTVAVYVGQLGFVQ